MSGPTDRFSVLRADAKEPHGKEQPTWSEVSALLEAHDHHVKRADVAEQASDSLHAALARVYLAADPDCPANPDGTGEWSIDDAISAVADLHDRADVAETEASQLLADLAAVTDERNKLRAQLSSAHADALQLRKQLADLRTLGLHP